MKKFEKFLKEINSGDNIQDDAYMLIHEDNETLQKRRQQLLNYLDKPETQQNKTKRDRYKRELNKIRNQLANRTPSGKLSGGFDDATGEGNVDYPKSKKDLIKKRKEYGISWDKKNKTSTITKDGLEKYARSIKGPYLPLTQDELDKAREYAIGGKEIKDARGKVIGKTTGKYGGKIAEPNTFQKFKNKASQVFKQNPNKGFRGTVGKRAAFGKFVRGPVGSRLIGRTGSGRLLRGLIAYNIGKPLVDKGMNYLKRQQPISSKNSYDTGPLVNTKTGKEVKFGFTPGGTPKNTQGSLFDKKVRDKISKGIGTGDYTFSKKKN